MTDFGEKIRPNVGSIISKTKCDRHKAIFMHKAGINKIYLGRKGGPKEIGKWGITLPLSSMRVHPTAPPPHLSDTVAMYI